MQERRIELHIPPEGPQDDPGRCCVQGGTRPLPEGSQGRSPERQAVRLPGPYFSRQRSGSPQERPDLV